VYSSATRFAHIPRRSHDGDGLRSAIRDAAKRHFILPQLLFRMLPVVDIGVIPYRPRMFPLRSFFVERPDARFCFERFSLRYRKGQELSQ